MTITPPGESLADAIGRHLRYSLARPRPPYAPRELFAATALAVRDRLVDGLTASEARFDAAGAKRVAYFSMEFLVGRSLDNNLLNLGLREEAAAALAARGGSLDEACDAEPDAALGNGGLGRLAACFLDSMATLGIAGRGYGINYEFGLFRQEIDGGRQREKPDHWRAQGTPWLVERPEEAVLVPCYGHIEHQVDAFGHYNPLWLGWRLLIGSPSDFPVAGWRGRTVNVLRLFSARSSEEFDMDIFNEGDYMRAVEQKMASETVSKVLYPPDALSSGKELRLLQEYFLVSCGLKDVVRRCRQVEGGLRSLDRHAAVQLNDTHPALAVVELMRILVDEEALPWEESWSITQATCGYTNHTLMPEALEKWPVPLLERVLPRHLQILHEINRRFLEEVEARWPGEGARARTLSLIEEGEPKQARMAHLAIVGSHSVNGVAALHSELVKTRLVPDFHALWPERFNNKTNGVTPRRWMLAANPGLSALVTRRLGGDAWIDDLERLQGLERFVDEDGFLAEFAAVKRANKERLAAVLRERCRVAADPDSLFDVQVKRVHEYKRQLLNLLGVVHEYLCLLDGGPEPPAARTVVFAGKAAPGYRVAKQIIELIVAVGEVVNRDPRTRGRLRVAFVPDYRVSLAEVIIPGGDLSEQVSTAGTEASGTGNMKFALNGAVTLGTLDGANIEIREAVGPENMFVFGLTSDEARARLSDTTRSCRDDYLGHDAARRVVDALAEGALGTGARFAWVRERLAERADPYLHLADLPSYLEARAEALRAFAQARRWTRMAALNTARTGRFSSDRTVAQYAREIWGASPAGPGDAERSRS